MLGVASARRAAARAAVTGLASAGGGAAARSGTRRALRGAAADGAGEERELQTLKKANSINSGVALSRGVSIGQEEKEDAKKSKVRQSLMLGDVHGTYRTPDNVQTWRKRPLFRRAGKNLTFKSGQEAAALLVDEVRRRDPYQLDFLQAVQESSQDVAVTFENAPKLAWVFKQLMEPERLITFRVPWTDDNGNARINRGYRIQYSSALGHYHGGVRFHPQLSHGSMRMLGWEQTLKNALTGAEFGGSRGGSDFDPTTKSEAEIKRFCQSFMSELCDFIGADLDTLETDLGVGAAEMAALHESFLQLNPGDGGDASLEALFGACRAYPEASGHGSVFFAERALEVAKRTSLEGKRCLISGCGTLARGTAAKLIEMGARPLTLSDATGFVHDPAGFSHGDLDNMAAIRASRGSLRDYARATNKTFHEAGTIWEQVKGDLAFPCTMQGELNADDAQVLADNGCVAVIENADRACTPNAHAVFEQRGVLFAPSKAVNSGSVVASAAMPGASRDELEDLVKRRMEEIHDRVLETSIKYNCPGNLRAGANLAAFVRIANSPMYVASGAQ
jgi:glutamate dehydrogenase (NADP+)